MGVYIPNVDEKKFYEICKEHNLDFVAIPAADVAPVKHGRNIRDEVRGHMEFKCSLCGGELSSVYGGRNDYGMDGGYFNFCPNCGAKMDGGET